MHAKPRPAATRIAARGTARDGGHEGWRLIWRDEFSGNRIDPGKWSFDIGNGFYDYRNHAWVPGWGNHELQYYTDRAANAEVRNSLLTIRALKESLHGCGYTSARLTTRRPDGTPLFATCYGRVEVRAKVPHGKGLWPAIWMLPVEDRYGGWAASGEIDIMEIVGERPGEYVASSHFGSTFPRRELRTFVHAFPGGGSVGEFHTYAVDWEPGVLSWSVDGVAWARQDFWWSSSRLRAGRGVTARSPADLNPWPAPFDQPFYLLLNVAVGGNFPGNPNEQTRFPAELVIDYVRVYERIGGYGPVAPRGAGAFPWQRRGRRPK